MLSQAPFGAVVLGGAYAAGASAPIDAMGQQAIRWSLRLLIDGEDWSARLVGRVTVDREEGAAGIANFVLCLPEGAVSPAQWKGKSVVLDELISMGGAEYEYRRFTGRLVDPSWDRHSRSLNCGCSDQLQQRVEALSVTQIDTLVGGYWSEDVFEPLLGRKHWEYAQERLQSVTGSLDCDTYGQLRVSSWYAKARPDYVFGEGSTLDASLDVQLSDLSDQINSVEIEADYRFARLWQQNKYFGWTHPEMAGLSGIQGFCQYYYKTSELPTIDMVVSAIEGAGLQIASAVYQTLPASGIYCSPPVGWVAPANHSDLLLSVGAVGARRWSQAVTENYRVKVQAQASIAAVGEVIERIGTAVDLDDEAADSWLAEKPTGEAGHVDQRDEVRRSAMLITLLHQARRSIVSAHRGTQVSWSVPAAWVGEIDLTHTAELIDQGAHTQAKVCRVQHEFDLASGEAMAHIAVAVMRGGGDVADALSVPDHSHYSAPSDAEEDNEQIAGLATQLADGQDDPEYDEDRDGFSGNWSMSSGQYPRRFQVSSDDVPEGLRDELNVELPSTYRIVIPDDVLELY